MVRGLYIAASGINLQSRKNDVYAANLANVSTAGYRRSQAAGEGFVMSPVGRAELRAAESPMLLAASSQAPVDLRPGPIVETGNDFDLAINGRGLFCVQTPQGEAYTADGQFQLNEQHVLINDSGFPVLGQNGPIRITSGEFT